MTAAECIGENQTLLDAAKRMAELDVGVLPICGDDDRLKGMLTDRDIVVKALAQGRDPATPCGEFAQGTVHWITADASLDEALDMMREHAVKRLCVMDDKRLSGIITEADVATHASEHKTGELGRVAAGAGARGQPRRRRSTVIETESLTDPSVRAFVAAVNAGDKDAFYAALAENATMFDDGSERDLDQSVESEIFSTDGSMEVDSEDDDGRALIVNYTNSKWGSMRTSWKFSASDGKIAPVRDGTGLNLRRAGGKRSARA